MNAIKECYKCKIQLNEDNKIKGKNMCKNCNKFVCKEKYEKRKEKKEIVIKIKHCKKCDIELTDDIKVKHRLLCKTCNSLEYKNYVENKLTNNFKNSNIIRNCSKCNIKLNEINQIKNRPICKPCHNLKCKEYKQNNKEIVIQKNKDYYEKNKDLINNKNSINYYKNKEEYSKIKKLWRVNNREKINQTANIRFKNNPIARLKKNCRTRIFNALKDNDFKSFKLVDCDIITFKNWLEYNFTEGMTFENYGSYWHVDHVLPCAIFDLLNEEDIKHCFRWTNLRPLEATKNMSKQDKIDKNEIIKHYNKVKEFATNNNIKLENFNYTKYF